MKFDRSEPGIIVSGLGHAAVLVAGLVAFQGMPPKGAEDSVAVEVISDTQFSQLTKGERQARTIQENPKPRADRVAEVIEQKDPGEAKRDTPAPPTRPADLKIAEEAVAPQQTPPPPARPQVAQTKPEPKPEPPQPDPKATEDLARLADQAELVRLAKAAEDDARAKADAKAKADADAKAKALAKLKADADAKLKAEADAKAKAKADAIAKAKADADAKARREAELAQKFNPGDINRLLTSKEPTQSTGATGREVVRTASLGTPTANAPKLSVNQIGALIGILREQIERCYSAPIGATGGQITLPLIRVELNQDGSLANDPRIMRSGSSTIDRSVTDAAQRAIRRCAPYKIPAQFAPFYSDWRSMTVEFEPPA